MTQLRDIINENSSLEDLVILRSHKFDFDVVDYIVLSRLEAKLKYKMGETDSWSVMGKEPDEICIVSHYSPASTKVIFALLYQDIASRTMLSDDTTELFNKLEEAYFQYQLAKGEYDRDNPKGGHTNTRYKPKVDQKQKERVNLLKEIKEKHPELYMAFTESVETQRDKVRKASKTNVALNGFIRNPELYDKEQILSDDDKEIIRKFKDIGGGEGYENFSYNYKIPNPNHSKQELMHYQDELVKAIKIFEPVKLAAITNNAYLINAHGITEQLVTIFSNDFHEVG